MRQLSIWAKNNRWPAISMIVIASIGIGFSISYVGNCLLVLGYHLSDWVLLPAFLFFILGWMLYPRRRFFWPTLGIGFRNRKICDALLILSGLIFYLHFGNTGKTVEIFQRGSISRVEKVSDNSSLELKLSRKQKQKQRRSIRRMFRQIRKAAIQHIKIQNNVDGFTALRGLLTLMLASLLFVLVLSLSCNLSCSGQIGASYFVLYFGFLAVLLISLYGFGAFSERNWKRDGDAELEIESDSKADG